MKVVKMINYHVRKKMRSLILASLLLMFVFSNFSHAGVMTFQREYNYQASEIDSKVSSRTIAIEQVKRLLLEELGTYLESKTEVINFQLTKDQITSLTAGIVKTEITAEEWDGKTYHLIAKIAADPDEVIKSVDILRKDQEKIKELEDVNKKADNALKEVARLKKELEISKKDKVKIDQYNEAVQELTAAELVEKGVTLSKKGHYSAAIETFTEAIKNNARYLWAYYHRGIVHKKMGNYKQSINDFNQSIKIDPTFSWAYYNRGLAYSKIGDKKQSLNDFKRAAQLGDRFAQDYLTKRKIKWNENVKQYANNAITPNSGIYVASRYLKVFHRSDCKWAMKINSRNRIVYNSIKEAEKNQKRPCSLCNPVVVKPDK